jgi:hypothetical protein
MNGGGGIIIGGMPGGIGGIGGIGKLNPTCC